MNFKVYEGTPTDGPHLCKTCTHAVNMTVSNERRTFCHAIPSWASSRLTGKVTQCTSYESDHERRILREHGQAAWYLDRSEDGKLEWSTPAERNSPLRTRVSRRNPRRAPAPADPPPPAPAAQPSEPGSSSGISGSVPQEEQTPARP